MELKPEVIEQLQILDNSLNDTDRETLIAFVKACDRSTNARVSFNTMKKSLSSEYRQDGEKFKEVRKDSVKNIIKKRLVYKNPSGKKDTYKITKTALLYYDWLINIKNTV